MSSNQYMLFFVVLAVFVGSSSLANCEEQTVLKNSADSIDSSSSKCIPDASNTQMLEVELLTDVNVSDYGGDDSSGQHSGVAALFRVNSAVMGKDGCKIREGNARLLTRATANSAQKRVYFKVLALTLEKRQSFDFDGELIDSEGLKGLEAVPKTVNLDDLKECGIVEPENRSWLARSLVLKQSCRSVLIVTRGSKGRVVLEGRREK